MPNPKKSTLNNLKSIDQTNLTTKESINVLTSFGEVKEFKKRDLSKILPAMTVDPELVEKFKQEAKDKNWTKTALMNEILKKWYEEKEMEK